jgi:uncharacterized phage-associated protein
MARAIDVANYLIKLAASEDEPEYLTHLHIQKLLYYVQGWSFAMRDTPMFPERIEAWAKGPVVSDVYRQFSGNGFRPIMPDDHCGPETGPNCPKELTEDECYFVRQVWDVYKGYSAIQLSKMTHNEQPWIEARGNAAPADRCNYEITVSSMKAFFHQLAEK